MNAGEERAAAEAEGRCAWCGGSAAQHGDDGLCYGTSSSYYTPPDEGRDEDPTAEALADAAEHLSDATGLLFRLFPELNDDDEEARLPPEARRLRLALGEASTAVDAVLRATRGRA